MTERADDSLFKLCFLTWWNRQECLPVDSQEPREHTELARILGNRPSRARAAAKTDYKDTIHQSGMSPPLQVNCCSLLYLE